MNNGAILVVDDEPKLARFVRLNLESEGFEVRTVFNGTDALTHVRSQLPSLVAIILDVMLPDIDGFQVCAQVREFSNIPILMLTAKGEMEDKVRGLDTGADDYLTKPFGADELLARLRAVLRRTQYAPAAPETARIVAGELEIDLTRRQVLRAGAPVRLSPTEYKLLYQLATNPDRTLLHEDLVSRVWGGGFASETDNLRTYIRYLRQKLESDPAKPQHILTEPGIGYRFQKKPLAVSS